MKMLFKLFNKYSVGITDRNGCQPETINYSRSVYSSLISLHTTKDQYTEYIKNSYKDIQSKQQSGKGPKQTFHKRERTKHQNI